MPASATSSTSLQALLPRTYNREDYFAPHERAMTKFYDTTQDFADGGKPLGIDRRFAIRTKDSHSAGSTAELTDQPAFTPPSVLQAALSAIQIAATVAWSELLMAVAQGEGILNASDIIDDHVKMTTRNLMSALNRLSLGHGTGRMAVVQTSTVASTTFVCRLPEHVLQLREGMTIAFYDADTAGTKQGNTNTIVSINFETRTVTLQTAVTLTAGWSIYKSNNAHGTAAAADEYGVAPYGLRAIVDNGGLQTLPFTLSRSTNPQLNATVLDAGGGTQAYTEKLIRKGLNRVFYATGLEVEEIWTNRGIIGEHLNHVTGQRMFTVGVTDGVPKYQLGANMEALSFQHNGKPIPFKVDSDIPAREAYGITRSLFRRHVLRKPGWFGDEVGPDGAGSPVLMQAPGSSNNYNLSKVAGMLAMLNFGHLQPKANVAWKEIADEELAGDS